MFYNTFTNKSFICFGDVETGVLCQQYFRHAAHAKLLSIALVLVCIEVIESDFSSAHKGEKKRDQSDFHQNR